MKSENFEMAIGEIVWLITLLANQSILIHNLKDKEHPNEMLTEDVVELLITPVDLAGYKTAIMEALYKCTKRNVKSEKDAKKTHQSGNGLRCGAVYPASLLRPCPSSSQQDERLDCCWICGSAISSIKGRMFLLTNTTLTVLSRTSFKEVTVHGRQFRTEDRS